MNSIGRVCPSTKSFLGSSELVDGDSDIPISLYFNSIYDRNELHDIPVSVPTMRH
jgi:hypothetical protein